MEEHELLRYYGAIQDSKTGYLPMNELQAGWAYWIFARNAHLGVWWPEKRGFIIPRVKFDRHYLFVEYHADSGVKSSFPMGGEVREIDHGTAKPFDPIEKAPFEPSGDLVRSNNAAALAYLEKLQATLPLEEAIRGFYRRITE